MVSNNPLPHVVVTISEPSTLNIGLAGHEWTAREEAECLVRNLVRAIDHFTGKPLLIEEDFRGIVQYGVVTVRMIKAEVDRFLRREFMVGRLFDMNNQWRYKTEFEVTHHTNA